MKVRISLQMVLISICLKLRIMLLISPGVYGQAGADPGFFKAGGGVHLRRGYTIS